MWCKVNNLITDVGIHAIHFEATQSPEFCKSHWRFVIFENDFGFDLFCVPAVTWRMLSLETTNKRPIWLSLEPCHGLFLAFAHSHIVSAHHWRWFVQSCTCPHLHRLLYLLQQSSSSVELRIECSVVLGSLAMGTENNIKSLVDCQIIPALLQGFTLIHTPPTHTHACTQTHTRITCHVCVLTGLLCSDLVFIEACLRCLRTVFISPVTPVQLLYTVGFTPYMQTDQFSTQPVWLESKATPPYGRLY